MQLQNLPEMMKVLQAGIEEYYGLHATVAPPLDSHDPETKLIEKQIKMNLFWVIFQIHSPTGKPVQEKQFQWHFVLPDGNQIHQQHSTGLRHSYGVELTLDTELKSVEVLCQGGDDDFLCYLRPYVKQKMAKVNILLRWR